MRKHEELTNSLRASAAAMPSDAARYRWLAGHCRSTAEHWGGRWSIIVDGPAPKSHDSEDDFDVAVDAARARLLDSDLSNLTERGAAATHPALPQ